MDSQAQSPRYPSMGMRTTFSFPSRVRTSQESVQWICGPLSTEAPPGPEWPLPVFEPVNTVYATIQATPY